MKWLIETYSAFEDKEHFFLPYFDKLAGTDRLRKDIQAGIKEDAIRMQWNPELAKFRALRGKYLLYE